MKIIILLEITLYSVSGDGPYQDTGKKVVLFSTYDEGTYLSVYWMSTAWWKYVSYVNQASKTASGISISRLKDTVVASSKQLIYILDVCRLYLQNFF